MTNQRGESTSSLPDDLTEIVTLVRARVRLRFALAADTFAARVAVLAHSMSREPTTSLGDAAARLNLDDLYLADACARGEDHAWEEVLARHLGFMREFARRFLREPDAGDIVDHVVADLWQRQKMARYEGRSALRTWLATVVAHAALNAGKVRLPALSLDDDRVMRKEGPLSSLAVTSPVGDEQSRTLLARLVSEAIAELPPDEKVLLLMYYEQQLTLDEIAIAVHASKAAVSRRLKRVRGRLRARLDQLATRTAGATADAVRAGVDLAALDLDLGALVSGGAEGNAGKAVK